MAFRGWKAPKKQAADEGLAARVASLEAAVASLMSQNGHGKADIAKAMVEGVVSSAKSKSDMKTGLWTIMRGSCNEFILLFASRPNMGHVRTWSCCTPSSVKPLG